MQRPKTVEITIHIHNGKLETACPDPCVVEPGDKIVWKTCDPQDRHFLRIENFREAATGTPHNPMKEPDFDLPPQSKATGEVDGSAAKMTYRYTVKVVYAPSVAAHANEYVKRLALAGEPSPAQAEFSKLAPKEVAQIELAPHLLQMFGSVHNFFGFTKWMLCSYSDEEMNPEVQVGGTGG